MRSPMQHFAAAFASNMILAVAAVHAQDVPPPVADPLPPVAAPLTPEAINAAPLDAVPPTLAEEPATPPTETVFAADGEQSVAPAEPAAPKLPDPAIARLQILLDRAGASPGVIDGFDGANVRKAVAAIEAMYGLNADGVIDPDMIAHLDQTTPVVGSYTITDKDVADIVEPLPEDYAELAKRKYLGYTSVAEELAERFHMDVDFLKALNPGAQFVPGETIFAANVGPDRTGEVALIQADKAMRQVRAYDGAGLLLAAYPATIGSEDNPSPSGTHKVNAAVFDPPYTYNPKINFQQGNNTEVLELPPGPNGPVGNVWIDLDAPTYGIHGTPEPSLIDKTGSHGCVRLTNWDATELGHMVKPGVTVEFIGGDVAAAQ